MGGKPPVIYECLRCKEPFRRKLFPSGSSSCGKKYCSRECAFAARKEKLHCARRPVEVAAECLRYLKWWRKERKRLIADEKRRVAGGRKCRECGVIAAKKNSHLCGPCGAAKKRDRKRSERQKHRKEVGGDNYRQRCRRSGAPYTPLSRKAILDRDNWTCKICGVELLRKYTKVNGTVDPRSPTIDHIIPIVEGPLSPGHVESNVHAACWGCNCDKRDTPLATYAPRKANLLP